MPKNGEYITAGEWRACRWCESCNYYHGHLYPCDSYPQAIKNEIAQEHENMINNFLNPSWVQDQLDNDIPPVAIQIMGLFAGVQIDFTASNSNCTVTPAAEKPPQPGAGE